MTTATSSSREQIFSRLFQDIARKYRQAGQETTGLLDTEAKAFLSSIGYTEQEFFDFIRDSCEMDGDYFFWYRKAAEQGDVTAQSGVGYIYANGLGVPQDHAQAAFWYRKAAEQGDMSAQSGMGYLHANGLGVAQDYGQAAFWYGKAAAKGSDYAQLYLAYQLQHGQGVSKDEAEALFWYRKAADQGNEQAREELRKLGHLPDSSPKRDSAVS